MLEKNSDAWHAIKRYIKEENGEKNEGSDMLTLMCQKSTQKSLQQICEHESWMYNSKGQLISEAIFYCFSYSKKPKIFLQISDLAFKMGQIRKILTLYYAKSWTTAVVHD